MYIDLYEWLSPMVLVGFLLFYCGLHLGYKDGVKKAMK
jgi:hypothetical protein